MSDEEEGDPGLEIKYEEFSSYLKVLEDRIGRGSRIEQITDYEVSKVLERAVEGTGKMDASKVVHNYEMQLFTTFEGKKYFLLNHYPNSLWHSPDEHRKASLAKKLAARGLSAQSWYIIARKLGYEIEAPAYVKNASYNGEDTGRDAMIERGYSQNDAYGVTLTNSMPILRFDPPGGFRALFTAIAGRLGYYRQNLAHGVFQDAEEIARAYPGIEVTELS